MTLRRRLAIAAAVAVAVAIALASTIAYLAIRSTLRGEVDASLRARAHSVQRVVRVAGPLPRLIKVLPAALPAVPFGGASGLVQLLTGSGRVRRVPGSGEATLVPSPEAAAIARGEETGPLLEDRDVGGEHLRILTVAKKGGGAIQVARPLSEVDAVLHELVLILVAITAGGVLLAALLGAAVSRLSLAPVERFTRVTEEVAEGPDPGRRIEGEGEDELGRLARTYNRTLEALERSDAARRRLVSDASHELRTPLTSVRTNLEFLLRSEAGLTADDRAEIERELVEQVDELTGLVEDVVELARDGEPPALLEEVDLRLLLEGELERARRHSPDLEFRAWLQPCTVMGVPQSLGRAVHNLLDNAAKWSPASASIEVELRGCELSVRDHGPGFDPEDLPHVFERFYRAEAARGRPGSGLGLAIVRQIAEAHGARVRAANSAGGGAVLTVSFREAAAGSYGLLRSA